jgi:hypothetical protein
MQSGDQRSDANQIIDKLNCCFEHVCFRPSAGSSCP